MKQTEKISAQETKKIRKEIRKASNHAALGSFLFTIINGVTAILAVILMIAFSGQGGQLSLESSEKFLESLSTLPFIDCLDIIAPLGGLLAVFLCFAKQGTHKQLFANNNSMTLPILGGLICVACLFDSVGAMFYGLIEWNLNQFGFSTTAGLEMVSGLGASSVTLIGTCFISPVVEELVFRGFLLRRMEKHGKVTAIVVTSVLFGLMHQNLPQILSAMMIGLVWGYVATEYSLGWSIALHIFENLVRVTLLNNLLANFSVQTQIAVNLGMMIVTAIIAIVILIRNRANIRSWIRESQQHKSSVILALCAPVTVLTVAYYIVNTIQGISLG